MHSQAPEDLDWPCNQTVELTVKPARLPRLLALHNAVRHWSSNHSLVDQANQLVRWYQSVDFLA